VKKIIASTGELPYRPICTLRIRGNIVDYKTSIVIKQEEEDVKKHQPTARKTKDSISHDGRTQPSKNVELMEKKLGFILFVQGKKIFLSTSSRRLSFCEWICIYI